MESALLASAGLGSLAPAAFTAGLSAGRFTAYVLERSFEALHLTLSISALGIVAFAIVAASPNPLLALLDQPAFRWTHLNADKLIYFKDLEHLVCVR